MMIKEYIIKINEDQSKKDIHGGYPLIKPPLELIRCKDCKYWSKEYDQNCMIKQGWFPVGPDWYCADGERK